MGLTGRYFSLPLAKTVNDVSLSQSQARTERGSAPGDRTARLGAVSRMCRRHNLFQEFGFAHQRGELGGHGDQESNFIHGKIARVSGLHHEYAMKDSAFDEGNPQE